MKRDNIVISANVHMDDLLAATTDLLIVEKIMSSRQRERTATRLNKVQCFLFSSATVVLL